jgi:poly(3-hydroxybutyrate) depolymerase
MASSLKRLAVRLAAAALTLIACATAPVQAQAQTQSQVAAGPGAWSGNQTWAADSVNGGNLTGYFYWPKNPPTLGGKRALVLVLHGCTQTASGDVIDSASDGGFNWKTVAEQYGAVILAPNATGNVYSNHCWDYASTSHNRTSGHDGVLLDLIKRFSSNS